MRIAARRPKASIRHDLEQFGLGHGASMQPRRRGAGRTPGHASSRRRRRDRSDLGGLRAPPRSPQSPSVSPVPPRGAGLAL